jgi:GNAT superfamily N-acetyltransferase
LSEFISELKIIDTALDVAAATPFFRKCFEHEYNDMLDEAVERHIETEIAESILANDLSGRKLRSAWIDGKLRGTAVGVQRDTHFFVWGMYVDPDFLRKGIGTRLLSDLCKGLPVGIVISVQVLDESIGALRFYSSMGFEPVTSDDVEVFPHVFRRAKILNCRMEKIGRVDKTD